MGEFKKITHYIFRSLLTLGFIENDQPASKNKLAQLHRHDHSNYIDREITALRRWLDDESRDILKGTRKGYKLDKSRISRQQYEEFLAVLLTLNMVRDQIDTIASSLVDGDEYGNYKTKNILGIVAGLINAKERNIWVSINYQFRRTQELKIWPKRIYFQDDLWLLDAKFVYNTDTVPLPLRINQIMSIENNPFSLF